MLLDVEAHWNTATFVVDVCLLMLPLLGTPTTVGAERILTGKYIGKIALEFGKDVYDAGLYGV